MTPIPIRLVDGEGNVVPGKLLRLMPTRVTVQGPRTLRYTCVRATGEPYGEPGLYRIHPEDIHLLRDGEEARKCRFDQRKARGVPPTWNV